MEFKSLRDGIKARLAQLNDPGVKQTEAVVLARKKMEAMLAASDGCCTAMAIEIEPA
jgi:hypothetical protein